MKITRKILEKLIREEASKMIEEFERSSLYGTRGHRARRSNDPLHADAHAVVLMDILAKLSEIEGKIDELSGKPPMNLP